MITKKLIQKEQAMHAIANGEFESNILSVKSRVVIVMTQDWCPQWTNMKSWIYGIEIDEDIEIYELEYNKVDYFYDFMNFKENHWRNYEVPYLRFYNDGVLTKETNNISESEFGDIVGK
ncbi:MAG TPA: hypothetical protein VIK78_11095 [Ruminiclostridium sp.]